MWMPQVWPSLFGAHKPTVSMSQGNRVNGPVSPCEAAEQARFHTEITESHHRDYYALRAERHFFFLGGSQWL